MGRKTVVTPGFLAGPVPVMHRLEWINLALRARAAMHRGDIAVARRELLSAQHLRPLLTYSLPYLAVQARLELARVHLALADLAGARTLMREVDDLLRRRPGLGTLVGQATAIRAQLSRDRGSSSPGASALTTAELRLLPLLSTHLSFPQIAGEMFLSRHTIKSQAMSIYRSWAPPPAAKPSPSPVSSASWRDDYPVFHPIGGMELAQARRGLVPTAGGDTQARADA